MANLKEDLAQIKTLTPKRKLLLAIVLILVFIVGFVLGVFFSQKGGKLTPLPTVVKTPKPAAPRPSSSLTIKPSSHVFKVGENLPVSVVLQKEPSQAVDVVLTFDPKVFSVSKIKKSRAFPNILRKKIGKGRLYYSASVSPQKPASAANGEVFSFVLTAKAATASSVLDFSPKETITAKNGENTLSLTVGARYEVK